MTAPRAAAPTPRPGTRPEARSARDPQHRPGQPVHQPTPHRDLDRDRRPGVDGGPGPLYGQRLDRAAPAVDEVRARGPLHAFETGSEARVGLGRWIAYDDADPGRTRPSAAGPLPRSMRASRPALAWRRDRNLNQAYPSRQTVRRSGTTLECPRWRKTHPPYPPAFRPADDRVGAGWTRSGGAGPRVRAVGAGAWQPGRAGRAR